jgi:hypothetical protein
MEVSQGTTERHSDRGDSSNERLGHGILSRNKPEARRNGIKVPEKKGLLHQKYTLLNAVTLIAKIKRRLQSVYFKARILTKKFLARAVYSLPILSRANPRHRLIKIKDHCRETTRFPRNDERGSQDWYLKVRSPETIYRAPSIGLNEEDEAKFRDGTLRYQFGNSLDIPEVLLACLSNARLYSGDFLVLSSDDRILIESALSTDEVLEKNGILDTLVRPSLRRVCGEFCLLASPWSNTYYYHWLMDALPRLSVIEQFPELKTIPLVVPDPLLHFHQQSLELAGISADRLVPFDGTHWKVDKLLFPQLLSRTGSPSPHAVAWLRSRFLPAATAKQSTERLLYITRCDAPKRKVLNEDEIIDYLQHQGFDVICPGALSFLEQITVFASAKIVVAPHGGALTNLVFAPSNAKLIEFFGDNYINGCFWALASICGQTHASLISPTRTLDYSVSLERLKTLLDKLSSS